MAQYDSIMVDGLTRTFQMHFPPDYDGTIELPLIIAMHGGFGNGPQLENQSQISVKADEENFIVVYPEGVQGFLNIRTWNGGECCGYAVENNIDDVGFIDALLDSLQANYAIDSLRVYATGMSNGGFMAYRLACELSHRIAAIAPVAASMALDVCSPLNKVPIIHFHSYLDNNIPFEGGVGSGFSNHYNPPLDSVLNVWGEINNCELTNDTVSDLFEYTHIVWGDCECDYSIEYYITYDGGHSWPGGQGLLGDPSSEFINANDLMWEFFQQYTLDCDLTLRLKETPFEKQKVKIFPNPTSGHFIIAGEKLSHITIYYPNGALYLDMEIHPSDLLNIDLSGEKPGTYFVQILFDENKREVLKIVLE
jgi:polyhydroxybutyrate depolymerase